MTRRVDLPREPSGGVLRVAAANACTALLVLCGVSDSQEVDLARVEVPRCSSPAVLVGQYDARAPGYFVQLLTDKALFAETLARMTRDYKLKLLSQWPNLNAFHAEMTPDDVARVRCDKDVKLIEYNAVTSI